MWNEWNLFTTIYIFSKAKIIKNTKNSREYCQIGIKPRSTYILMPFWNQVASQFLLLLLFSAIIYMIFLPQIFCSITIFSFVNNQNQLRNPVKFLHGIKIIVFTTSKDLRTLFKSSGGKRIIVESILIYSVVYCCLSHTQVVCLTKEIFANRAPDCHQKG